MKKEIQRRRRKERKRWFFFPAVIRSVQHKCNFRGTGAGDDVKLIQGEIAAANQG